VPGAEARGLVAPRMVRPVLTASLPSQTMATTGPTKTGKKEAAKGEKNDQRRTKNGNEGRVTHRKPCRR
jgi:hypothetical protein